MKNTRKYIALIAALALLFSLFAGCGKAEKAATTATGKTGTASSGAAASASSSGSYVSPHAPSSSGTAFGDGVIGGSGEESHKTPAEAGASVTAEAPMAAPGSFDMAMADGKTEAEIAIAPPTPLIEPPYQPDPQAGLLTAGEWNDNENYDFFLDVLDREDWNTLPESWDIYPTNRFTAHVVDSATQSPLKGAAVSLYSGDEVISSAVTDHNGNAYLYYGLRGQNYVKNVTSVKAVFGGSEASAQINGENSAELSLSGNAGGEKILDLMFMVDTTGSMGDELEYLKEELLDVIRRVSSANSGMKIRLSVNFYRDEEDEYVVKYFAFTEDIDKALADLDEQYSAGGGDTPEAVDTAFDNAVNGHDWSENSTKLLFFVLDAPPHIERQGSPELMRKCMEQSAEKGIRVIPIVSSGADTTLEFLMRTAAAVSGGTYTFLTDDSGIGFSHLEPTVGDYEVEALNALMIRIINEYCA